MQSIGFVVVVCCMRGKVSVVGFRLGVLIPIFLMQLRARTIAKIDICLEGKLGVYKLIFLIFNG